MTKKPANRYMCIKFIFTMVKSKIQMKMYIIIKNNTDIVAYLNEGLQLHKILNFQDKIGNKSQNNKT